MTFPYFSSLKKRVIYNDSKVRLNGILKKRDFTWSGKVSCYHKSYDGNMLFDRFD